MLLDLKEIAIKNLKEIAIKNSLEKKKVLGFHVSEG